MNDEQRDERQHGAAEARGPGDAAEERAENGADGAPEGAAQRVAAVDVGGMSRQELENELELARAEIERLQDQSLRRQAELVNFRRRAQKEIAESAALGQGRLLELLVPVVDDFERAVDAESEDVRAYHEGVELILRSLHKVLEQIGVERIDPRGEAFDPRYHEAIARHETDEVPDGHVLDVYQTGYRLGDRLIRPAAVVVAFGGAARSSDENADERTATTNDDDSNDG
jgi:molecular chaperone GrpE